MKEKIKKVFRTILIIVLVIVMVVCGWHVLDYFLNQARAEKPARDLEQQITDQSANDVSQEDGFNLSRHAWNDLKAQNSEIVAYLAFADGFVKEPIVQPPTSDPEKYLRHWIDGTYTDFGTVFVDANNNVATDQNLTIYGHSYDLDTQTRFSPLTTLVNQDAWEQHHEFTVWYDDRIAHYEIIGVQELDTYADHGSFVFNQANFSSEEEFNSYMDYVKSVNLINAHGDENIESFNKFITLQTCKRYNSRYHIILTCKQLSEEPWGDAALTTEGGDS